MEKLRRIFPLLLIYIIIVCLNIVVFAYLYDYNNSIMDPNVLDQGISEKNSVTKKDISIRISILGTDADAGELVFTSNNYHNSHIFFIKDFYDLWEWKKHQRIKINWHNFNLVHDLEKDKIQEFHKIQ